MMPLAMKNITVECIVHKFSMNLYKHYEANVKTSGYGENKINTH